jgi:hypothetical protein
MLLLLCWAPGVTLLLLLVGEHGVGWAPRGLFVTNSSFIHSVGWAPGAKWLLGAADVTFSFLSLQDEGGVTSPVSDRSTFHSL